MLKAKNLYNPKKIEALRQKIYDKIQKDIKTYDEEMRELVKEHKTLTYKQRRYSWSEEYNDVLGGYEYDLIKSSSVKVIISLNDEEPAAKVHKWFQRSSQLHQRLNLVTHYLSKSLIETVLNKHKVSWHARDNFTEITINGRKYGFILTLNAYTWRLLLPPEQRWYSVSL